MGISGATGSIKIIPQPANCGLGGGAIPYPIDMLATAWLLGITYPQSRNKAVNTLIYSKIQNYIAKIYRFSKFIYIFALIINKENYENYFA